MLLLDGPLGTHWGVDEGDGPVSACGGRVILCDAREGDAGGITCPRCDQLWRELRGELDMSCHPGASSGTARRSTKGPGEWQPSP